MSWPLLVATTRHAAAIAPASDVAQAAEQVADWPSALAQLREHGLLPWLGRAVDWDGIAPDRRSALRELLAADNARTLAQVRLLAAVLADFEDAGVPVLAYKGPALSLQLYGDVAMRRSSDLDVVVPRSYYDRARAVLVARGLAPRRGHSVAQERTLFAWLGQASFGTGDVEFIELHWRLAPAQFAFPLTPEAAIARSATVLLGGRSVRTLATDDLLVTLAMHGARHLYERFEWLAGVARLAFSADASPALLVQRASSLRARRVLLASVATAARVLDVRLSAEWQEEVARDAGAAGAGAELATLVVATMRDGAAQPGGVALQRLYAELADSPLDAMRVVAGAAVMPTEREWEMVELPDALTPLYMLVRPIRLVARYAERLLRGGESAG